MIVGGACRGLSRAIGHASSYVWAYLLAGIPIVVVMGVFWGDTEYGNFAGFMLVAHFLSVIVVWPAAVVANFAALRLFRPRSWRNEPWRGRVAGILGVPFCWGGLFVWPHIAGTAPDFMWSVSREYGEILYGLGVLILFSNLAVLLGWILPSRKPKPPRCREAPSAPDS
jgi:hypothetical protein